MSFSRPTKEEARATVEQLVTSYRQLASEYERQDSGYTETEARQEFIDPLLQALGWDVTNEDGLHQAAREVILERLTFGDESPSGRPDYRLRSRGRDRMPVEAKKPALRLSNSGDAARQARSYGWSLSLPAAVLTNFTELAIYDTTIPPEDGDHPDVALIPGCRFSFEDYIARFDELWERLSYDSIATDNFYYVYSYTEPPRGTSPFDRTFLEHFRRWREQLAQDLATRNPQLGEDEVGRRTQRLLNALLFLRVCEDRDISTYEELLTRANSHQLLTTFREADRVFNAGLFDVLETTAVTDDALAHIIRDLYWPRSKFAFGVLDAEILAGLYEQYLAERVQVDQSRTVELVQKPELTHAGGIVPTPDYIVEELLDAALLPRLSPGHGIPNELSILDPATGSGVFLVGALRALITADELAHGYPDIDRRGQLARNHIHGVDIDPEAVEVTRLSLLIAIIDYEILDMRRARSVLPDLSNNIIFGNSLISSNFDATLPHLAREPEKRVAVRPLDLETCFHAVMQRGGFDAIVSNPPYARIQVLSQHMPAQLTYFQHPASGYESSLMFNFDIYMLFLERAMQLLSSTGRLAFIVPHRFTNAAAGAAVRKLLGPRLERLVHFGEEQVFRGRTTYTALLIVGPPSAAPADLQLVSDLKAWREDGTAQSNTLPRNVLTADPWQIASAAHTAVFSKMMSAAVARVGDEGQVHIFVGVQTSADKIFLIEPQPESSDSGYVAFSDVHGAQWSIERALLRPALQDREIVPYDIDPIPDVQAIFPYTISPPEEAGKKPKAVPIGRGRMESEFPKALEYFEAHKAQLLARGMPDPGEEFWRYGRSQSLTALDEQKLIARVLSLTPRYALDYNGLLVPGGGDGGPYYLLRPHPTCAISIKVLVALLSHPVVDAYVAARGKAYHGSYVVHRKAFLKDIPIPDLDDEKTGMVEEMIDEIHGIAQSLREESDTAQRQSLLGRREVVRTSLEDAISAAFGLSQEEVETVVG